MARLRLMAVLAHPDDESLGFGGTLAKYAAEGVETFLVTATRGERGRYRGFATDDARHPGAAGLATIREAELRAAARELGVHELSLLDYEDSQIDRADPHELIAAVAGHIRRVRPDVVVTFGPDGAYGHPDHIAISQAATGAAVAAADPGFAMDDAAALRPHAVSKLYYLAWPRSTWSAYEEAFRKLRSNVDGVERQAEPWADWAITTVIDTRSSWAAVWRAVSCHESQISAYERLKDVTPEHHEALWGQQSFYRAFSTVSGGRARENDLFEGLRQRTPVSAGDTAPARGSPARNAPLAMEGASFREIGRALVDQIAEFLESVPGRPVTPNEAPSAIREALALTGPLPEHGADPGRLLDGTARLLFDHSLLNAHPRFFGYITAPPAPIGILADLLAAAVNANVGASILSPAATEIEAQTVRWIAEFIGFPTQCGGLLVSGGNMANFVCFLAARAAKAGWNVRDTGMVDPSASGHRLRVYASAETHTWIQKAADLAGLGTSSIRWIPTDLDLRMDTAALRVQIDDDLAAGDRPFMVVGTAGSVSTGAVDPLPVIAAICRERDIWFHVDGAYGGFAAVTPDAPDDLRALAEADSVAVDPHKWLYAPLEAGCALVRNPELLRAAFAYHPPYYHFEEQATNYVEYGPQNSRGFRALKVWLALRHAGAAGYRRMIADDMHLSRMLADAVRRHPELEMMTQSLSITTFRYVPAQLRPALSEDAIQHYLNTLNERLLDRLQRGGEAFVSNAIIRGQYVLRACIVNFHTDIADVEALPVIVARVGRELDAGLRPHELSAI
jgi:glutamate/tyrosine decarboxylase-like PLP-dependent enzyme/LmbE family N-acetylglucosaminyl deacetylase